MKRNCLLFLFGLAVTFTAFGQDDEVVDDASGLKFSGSVDAYFRQNLTKDNSVAAPPASFGNLPGFAIGMVNLIAEQSNDKVGFVADLAFGPRGTDAVFLSEGSSSIVNQLYVFWNVSDRLTFTFGNFNTYLGYEVISPTGNFNYSTSYMFSYGPFSHTGLKADYAINDKWSVMLSVMNPTDFTEFNPSALTNDAAYTLGAQLGYSADAGFVYLNMLFGDQDGTRKSEVIPDITRGFTKQADITAGLNLGESFYLGLNTTYNSLDVQKDDSSEEAVFGGVALYPQYTFSDKFALGLRGEYFFEQNGGAGALGAYDADGNADVIDLTVTGNITIGNLRLIPEFRVDAVSQEIFEDVTGATSSSLSSVLFAAVYAF